MLESVEFSTLALFIEFTHFINTVLIGITGSEAGLAISSAMMLAGSFQWGIRQSTEVENQMTSVERVIEYSNLESEAALESPPGNNKFFRMDGRL